MPAAAFDAIVLCGGRGSRLGGVDKGAVEVGGDPLLARARAAVAGAGTTVVVGAEVGGGPVHAVAAVLPRVGAAVVVLLACDMPFVTAATVARLRDALAGAPEADGVLLTDDAGHRQYLAGVYRTSALRESTRALGTTTDRSMRRLVEGLRLRPLPAQADEAMDCDTWDDVHRAAERLEDG
jgi:molybdopterin-guanine dinucleotide biosynthesis protein A